MKIPVKIPVTRISKQISQSNSFLIFIIICKKYEFTSYLN